MATVSFEYFCQYFSFGFPVCTVAVRRMCHEHCINLASFHRDYCLMNLYLPAPDDSSFPCTCPHDLVTSFFPHLHLHPPYAWMVNK